MALKAILKSLEGLSDHVKELYKKDGEEYHLDVEGMAPREQLDTFRENNRKLNKELETAKAELQKYDGIDLAKYKEAQELERKVREGELVKAGKIDEVLNARLDPILKTHADKEKQWTTEREQMARDLDVLTIDTKIQEIAVKKGVLPTALEDVTYRGQRTFTRKDGKVVALDKDGAQILTKEGKPLTIETFIDQLATDAPHFFKPSTGGGANPNPNPGGHTGKTMTRQQFEALDHSARPKFLADGGKVVDAA